MPPGCNLGPKLHLVSSRCECLTRFYCSKINMAISSEQKSHTSHYSPPFRLPRTAFFFVLSPSGFSFAVSQGEPSICHLISWIFILLFQGGCGSTYVKVHWGNRKKLERGGEIKACHLCSTLCESAHQHCEAQRRHPPRLKKMSSKCWHYRQCHLFLSRVK